MVDFLPGTRPARSRAAFIATVLAMAASWAVGTAAAASPNFCIDKGSPFFAIDRAVATAVARADHTTPHFTVIDTRVGADVLLAQKAEFFSKLATRCDLVMGFPVETGYPTLPKGVRSTQPYAHTGFVLAAPGSTAPSFASLSPQTKVGVTYLTVPSTYFDHGHGATLADHEYTTPGALYQALRNHDVAVALIWQPWLVNRLASTHDRIAQHLLSLPHAQWSIVALYRPAAAKEAARFDTAIAHLQATHRLAALIKPYR